MDADDLTYLTRAVALAREARERGDHPFGALLVTADGRVVEALNSVNTEHDPTGHAETNLVRVAASSVEQDAAASATLYTSTEPCAMCSGAIYWSGIGRVVFALSEQGLAELVGDSDEPTLDLPCREVFARGGRAIAVVGPVGLPEAAEVHRGFWV